MSESSVNLETLDNEDIYKQCLCFDETRCGPYTKHFEDGPFKLDELNKDISGHFENLNVCSFSTFFSFACISKTKRCRLRVLQVDPFIHSVHWGVKAPFQAIPPYILVFRDQLPLPHHQKFQFLSTLIILEIFILSSIPSFKSN